MKAVLIALVTSMCINMPCTANEVTFYVGQGHDEWALNVVGKGKAVIGDTLIYTEYEYVKFTNNPKHNKNKKIKYIAFDYAYSLPDGKWDIKTSGVRKQIDRELKPGEWMTTNWIDAKLKLEGGSPEKYWIVVTIATEDGLVHAHSRKDIFD